jgi:3-oxoacyl-[acyl-carrier protein] reductase
MSERIVLVTGATSGIGKHLAEHYLSNGWTVIGCGRRASAVEHPRYTHYRVDVSDPKAVDCMFESTRQEFGSLDALIANAGVASMNPIALTPAATAKRIIDTNVLGTFLLTHGAVRLLRKSGSGRIVNLTTIAVPARLSGEALYAASKAAVETFTRIAAKELGPLGITCNTVGPSPIRTRLTAAVPAKAIESLIARQAISRWAEPDDVANVVDFFLSPRSALVTGQVVYLGGHG